jgi:hypothetical protein
MDTVGGLIADYRGALEPFFSEGELKRLEALVFPLDAFGTMTEDQQIQALAHAGGFDLKEAMKIAMLRGIIQTEASKPKRKNGDIPEKPKGVPSSQILFVNDQAVSSLVRFLRILGIEAVGLIDWVAEQLGKNIYDIQDTEENERLGTAVRDWLKARARGQHSFTHMGVTFEVIAPAQRRQAVLQVLGQLGTLQSLDEALGYLAMLQNTMENDQTLDSFGINATMTIPGSTNMTVGNVIRNIGSSLEMITSFNQGVSSLIRDAMGDEAQFVLETLLRSEEVVRAMDIPLVLGQSAFYSVVFYLFRQQKSDLRAALLFSEAAYGLFSKLEVSPVNQDEYVQGLLLPAKEYAEAAKAFGMALNATTTVIGFSSLGTYLQIRISGSGISIQGGFGGANPFEGYTLRNRTQLDLSDLSNLLAAYFMDADDRRSIISLAFAGSTLLPQISHSGSASTFTTNLLIRTLDYGWLAHDRPALLALLEIMVQKGGADLQQKLIQVAFDTKPQGGVQVTIKGNIQAGNFVGPGGTQIIKGNIKFGNG